MKLDSRLVIRYPSRSSERRINLHVHGTESKTTGRKGGNPAGRRTADRSTRRCTLSRLNSTKGWRKVRKPLPRAQSAPSIAESLAEIAGNAEIARTGRRAAHARRRVKPSG